MESLALMVAVMLLVAVVSTLAAFSCTFAKRRAVIIAAIPGTFPGAAVGVQLIGAGSTGSMLFGSVLVAAAVATVVHAADRLRRR